MGMDYRPILLHCYTCEDGTMQRAGCTSYVTQNWWKQCSGLIWKVDWALTCDECSCILAWLPQHHRWGKKTTKHRITKKRPWQKTSTSWIYLGQYSHRCPSCGLQSQDDGPQLTKWKTYARTPSVVLPDIDSGLFDSHACTPTTEFSSFANSSTPVLD
jgi:hypothetical protein